MKKVWLLVVFVICALPVFSQDNGIKIGDTTWTFNGEIRFMYTDQTDPSYYQFFIMSGKDTPFPDSTDSINRMYQRYRFGITGALSDRLSAHFEMQVGDEQWGNMNYNEREVNLRTLYAYLQFRPEFLGDNTSFRVGLQGYDDIFQNSIFSDEGVGIMVNHATDNFNANIGYLTLRDDDVDGLDTFIKGPSINMGIFPCSETLFIGDATYKATDTLTVKGAFYYDYIRDFLPGESDSYNYHMAYYGAGLDYLMNDSMSFGSHFVMRSGKVTEYLNNVEDFVIDINGWFAYAYATYTMDKFSAKVNFGYTPFSEKMDADGISVTTWSGAFPLMDYGYAEDYLFMFVNGDQWQNAYGLEYFGRGDVCDRQAVAMGYGNIYGLMVISANLEYDFLYANVGIMNTTFDEDDFGAESDSISKSLGTELDLGVKTEVMKGLEFRAVYAMFFAGDFYTFNGERTVDDAHEMSMLLRYKF